LRYFTVVVVAGGGGGVVVIGVVVGGGGDVGGDVNIEQKYPKYLSKSIS